jgi:excisionase family DNA binding protein
MRVTHPGLTGRKIGADLEPLAVSPRQACVLLSIGMTRLYDLIKKRELASYLEGRSRRITMQSIRARVARLAAAAATGDTPATQHRRGRPRKNANAAVLP